MNGCLRIASCCDPANVFGVCWHQNLVKLIMWLAEYTGEIVITSGRRYRALYAGDSGIHMTDPLRAMDIRYYIYNDPDKLCDIINQAWEYDRTRPRFQCAKLHDTGRGLHFHLQVHDRTRKL